VYPLADGSWRATWTDRAGRRRFIRGLTHTQVLKRREAAQLADTRAAEATRRVPSRARRADHQVGCGGDLTLARVARPPSVASVTCSTPCKAAVSTRYALRGRVGRGPLLVADGVVDITDGTSVRFDGTTARRGSDLADARKPSCRPARGRLHHSSVNVAVWLSSSMAGSRTRAGSSGSVRMFFAPRVRTRVRFTPSCAR
jgi:hypothetical protein